MPIKDPDKRREYHRNYNNKRYSEDLDFKNKHRMRVDKNDAKYCRQRQEIIDNFRLNGCKYCPEVEPCCMSAHHLDPSQKEFAIAEVNRLGMAPAKLIKELNKCICVCENCHRKIHAGKLIIGVSPSG